MDEQHKMVVIGIKKYFVLLWDIEIYKKKKSRAIVISSASSRSKR